MATMSKFIAAVPVGVASLSVLVGVASLAVRADAAELASERGFDCLVDARTRVKLGASVSGVIEKVHVDRGDRVRAGQPLVDLESSVEKAQLAIAKARADNDQAVEAARARLTLARRTAERLTQLRQSNPGALTATQYDEAMAAERVAAFNVRDAELGQEAAKLDAARAEAVLGLRRIVSPFDGVVVDKSMSAGEYRHDQSSLLTLARIDPLNVEVYVPVAYFGQMAIGSKADVTLQAPVGTTHEAVVEVVDRVLDTASGTFGIRLTLANPKLDIPAGLRCKIRFRAADGVVAQGSAPAAPAVAPAPSTAKP